MKPNILRWIIVGLVFVAMVLNYVDRQIVSVLKVELQNHFDLSEAGYAQLLNIFMLCYAISYPTIGWLVDRFGVRWAVIWGIITWSAACMGAGFATSIGALMFFRGLLGLAETAIFPAQIRIVTTWFPESLRATANSLCIAGTSIGSIIAPPLIAYLTLKYSWQHAFIIPGAVGLILATVWFFIYRDPRPGEVEQPEASMLNSDPAFSWSRLWLTRSLYGIILIRFISDPVWYFTLMWLPGYLRQNLGISLAETGKVTWIPFLVADLSAVLASMWSDRMVKKGKSVLTARRIMLTSLACLAPLVMLTPHFPKVWITLTIFSLIAAMCLSWLFTIPVVSAEIFPKGNVGSVMGISAGFGALGGIIFNNYIGKDLLKQDPTQVFFIMGLLHPIAVVILWKVLRKESNPHAHSDSVSQTPVSEPN